MRPTSWQATPTRPATSLSTTARPASVNASRSAPQASRQTTTASTPQSRPTADTSPTRPLLPIWSQTTRTEAPTSLSSTAKRTPPSGTGEQGNGSTERASISADGRYVAYSSTAFNLSPEDGDSIEEDVFVYDRQTGITTQVSVSST